MSSAAYTSSPAGNEPKIAKIDLTKVPYHKILKELEQQFKSLWSTKDLTKDILQNLNFISECSKTNETISMKELEKIRQLLLEGGIIELFTKIWDQNFEKLRVDEEDKMAYANMKFIMNPVKYSSHQSVNICERILERNLHKDLFVKYLNSDIFSPSSKRSASKQHLIRGIMGITHNLLQNVNARGPIRDIGGVEILMKFRDSYTNLIKIKTEILLAYLIDEKQNDQINSTSETFAYLIKVLTDCLENDGHHSKRFGGYDAVEIIRALEKLSATDENKRKIVESGGLPLLVRLLGDECIDEEERFLSANVLWSLAFTTKDEILQEPGCLEGLRNLMKVDSTASGETRKAAEGALWLLGNANSYTTTGKVSQPGHVFISYQWSTQETILQVRDRLRYLGLTVWLDVDNMSGSILEAMASAVEEASVVVICLCQKYKESPNCRTEGEYAYRLGKKIVPLNLEPAYQPDGWLGAMLGNKLWFDVSTEESLEANFTTFVRELKLMGAIGPSAHPAIKPWPESEDDKDHAESATIHNDVCSWGKQQVQEWLSKYELGHVSERLVDYDGGMLLGLIDVMKDAPEYFYKSLKEEFDCQLKDSIKLSRVLKDLDKL